MAIAGLKIIGESINDSVPKTKKLFEDGDLEGIAALARFQEEKGAEYIDVNIGGRDPSFMATIVRLLQDNVSLPFSIDSPDIGIARAGLEAYDPKKAQGKIPLVNSITESRMEMFDLYTIQPFKITLLVSERMEGGKLQKNKTGAEIYNSAKKLSQEAKKILGITNDELIVDPGMTPIGADMEGATKMVLEGMRLIHNDPDLRGIHFLVGLSNFSTMLPSKRSDGLLVKTALENAFLTLAVPLGLDHIIGNVTKDYQLLDAGDEAYQTLIEAIALRGIDAIARIRQFYKK